MCDVGEGWMWLAHHCGGVGGVSFVVWWLSYPTILTFQFTWWEFLVTDVEINPTLPKAPNSCPTYYRQTQNAGVITFNIFKDVCGMWNENKQWHWQIGEGHWPLSKWHSWWKHYRQAGNQIYAKDVVQIFCTWTGGYLALVFGAEFCIECFLCSMTTTTAAVTAAILWMRSSRRGRWRGARTGRVGAMVV